MQQEMGGTLVLKLYIHVGMDSPRKTCQSGRHILDPCLCQRAGTSCSCVASKFERPRWKVQCNSGWPQLFLGAHAFSSSVKGIRDNATGPFS